MKSYKHVFPFRLNVNKNNSSLIEIEQVQCFTLRPRRVVRHELLLQ